MYKLLAASALSLALLSGTAIAQVSVDGAGDGSVEIGGTSADVGADAGVETDELDTSTSADADATLDTEELDTEATGAVGADAEINAALDAMGDDANAFFTDESRTELKAEPEIQAAFSALSPEQQESLRSVCAEASASTRGSLSDPSAEAAATGSAGLCAAIGNI